MKFLLLTLLKAILTIFIYNFKYSKRTNSATILITSIIPQQIILEQFFFFFF